MQATPTNQTAQARSRRGGVRVPGPGKRLGRPPKIHHAIQRVKSEADLLALLDETRKEASRVLEGMADPSRLSNVIDAIYKLSVGYEKESQVDTQCPKCQAQFKVATKTTVPPNVKAQELWIERVAGKVPQTTVLRDPAREGYLQLMKEIRQTAPAEQAALAAPANQAEGEVIDSTGREV